MDGPNTSLSKCNRCDKDSNVKWLNNTKPPISTLFGNNNYTDMISAVFKTKNINI